MLSVAASVSEEGPQLPGRYYPAPPHPTPAASGDDAMLSVATSVSKEGTQLPGRYYPTPPHPPASGDDAMLSVAASVSEEGTQLPGRYYPTPPHPTPTPRIWRRCHVECGRKCARGRNAAARTLLSHTPPHLETMLCWLWPQLWRGCWFLSHADGGWEWHFFGCEILLFWLRNRLFLVAESSFFGCGIGYFWLRNRFFFGCGSAFFWLRKRVWFWLRNRRNLVAEASKYGFGIGLYPQRELHLRCTAPCAREKQVTLASLHYGSWSLPLIHGVDFRCATSESWPKGTDFLGLPAVSQSFPQFPCPAPRLLQQDDLYSS